MSVTEVAGGAAGEWSISLSNLTPKEILDAIDYWGHIVVTSSRVNPVRYGDALFDNCRYSGVLRKRNFRPDVKEIAGVGLDLWIGDEDDKGDAIEDEVVFSNEDFTTVVTTLLPPTVEIGTIYPQAGLHTNNYKLTGRRAALDYVQGLYGVERRVRGMGIVDVGTPAELYPAEPTCAIVRGLPAGGVDTDGLRAFPGNPQLEADMEDYTTRVVTVGEGNGLTVAVGSAELPPEAVPYLDLRGNPIKMTRLVSEQNTSLINADARAQIYLDQFSTPNESITLSAALYDIKGDLLLGGYIWVQDDEAKITGTELVTFKGMRLYPIKLRCTELQWPFQAGMGVYYRHWNGTWYDLSPYYIPEDGETTITVNGYNRPLTQGTSPNDPIGGQTQVDTTTPDTPEWNEPIESANYPGGTDGIARAEFYLSWQQPLNQGTGTIVEDGHHYEIRYRRVSE